MSDRIGQGVIEYVLLVAVVIAALIVCEALGKNAFDNHFMTAAAEHFKGGGTFPN